MSAVSNSGCSSLLREYVEKIPDQLLNCENGLNWEPSVPIDLEEVIGASPTTEYSSKEDDE